MPASDPPLGPPSDAEPRLLTAEDAPANGAHRLSTLPEASARSKRTDVARMARRTQRPEQYERARALRDEGYTWAVVAQQVGVPPCTLRSWFAREGFPERKRRTGDRSSLTPYRAYLRQRWEAMEHSATQLWHELRSRASVGRTGAWPVCWHPDGSARSGAHAGQRLRQWLAPLRCPRADGPPDSVQLAPPFGHAYRGRADPTPPGPAGRSAPRDAGYVHGGFCADGATVGRRTAGSLVGGVLASPWRALKRFAQGLRQDYAAVKAALTWPYSNGPTEGYVNRLKLFKHQIYGRAKLDLLRQRVLYAA